MIDALLCAVLRGEEAVWPGIDDSKTMAAMRVRAVYHGVNGLLCDHMARLSSWPRDLRDAIRDQTMALTYWEHHHRRIIGDLVEKLCAAGITPIVFKGTALAYAVYRDPLQRARGDTDMIVSSDDYDRASSIMISAGFTRDKRVSGELISYQEGFSQDAGPAGSHAIDLHRKINNSEILSRLFSHAELMAAAQPLTALCDGAMAAGPVHALLLACFHPATHRTAPFYSDGVAYLGSGRLIWLYDVHLLAQILTAAQWEEFVRSAKEKGLCTICREILEQTSAAFHTELPAAVLSGLAVGREPIGIYLNSGALRRLWIDFQTLGDVSSRATFVRELIFPHAAYMRDKYAGARVDWLPWLYARRAVEGVFKRI